MDAPRLKVELRHLHRADLDAVHALVSNFEVVRYMLFPVCSSEQSQEFLEDAISESPSRPWRSVTRAIVIPECPDELLGLCGLAIMHGSADGELWYLVSPANWGQGIATRAAELALAIGFDELALHRVYATCLPENPASVCVLEKIGMRREGFQFKSLKIHGEWRSCYQYAILDEEWRNRYSARSASMGAIAAAAGPGCSLRAAPRMPARPPR